MLFSFDYLNYFMYLCMCVCFFVIFFCNFLFDIVKNVVQLEVQNKFYLFCIYIFSKYMVDFLVLKQFEVMSLIMFLLFF